MSSMNIAIIGCGKQAEKHISGLVKIPDVKITLVDTNTSRASSLAQKFGLDWRRDAYELITSDGVDAVDICTPTMSHYDLISAAIDNKKHFFCEKPLTADLEHALDLSKKLSGTDLIGMTGYIYRFSPVFDKGYRIVKASTGSKSQSPLGQVSVAHFRLSGRGSHQTWKHMKASGGGAINEMLVHMVDLAVWYFGDVEKVDIQSFEHLRKKREIAGEIHETDAEDYVVVKLLTGNGVPIYCHADLVTPSFLQFADIQGDNGTFFGSIQPDIASYLFLEKATGEYGPGKNTIDSRAANLYELQMGEFVSSIREYRQPDRSTIEDSIKVMRAMNMIMQELDS